MPVEQADCGQLLVVCWCVLGTVVHTGEIARYSFQHVAMHLCDNCAFERSHAPLVVKQRGKLRNVLSLFRCDGCSDDAHGE